MTDLVKCMVAQQAISIASCVDRQESGRCFCPQAAVAINRMSEDNSFDADDEPSAAAAKKKVRTRLEVLKDRAAGFFRKPSEQRYGGPALVALKAGAAPTLLRGETESEPPSPIPGGGKIAAILSGAAPLAPNLRPTCEWPGGCTTPLAVNNLTKLCRLHRNKVSSRKRADLVPKLARVAGTARHAIESDREDLTPKEPALVQKVLANQARTKEIEKRMTLKREKYLARNGDRGSKGTSRDAREPAASGVRRSPAPEPGHVERQVAGAGPGQQVPNGPIDAPAAPVAVSSLSLAATEETAIRAAHQKLGGNVRQMASELGIARSTLHRKMDAIGLRVRPPPGDEMPNGPLAFTGKTCPGCKKNLRADNSRGACHRCVNKLPPSLRPPRGGWLSAAAVEWLFAGHGAEQPEPVKVQAAAPGVSVVEGLDLGTLTMAQLLACPAELRRRLQIEHDKYSDLARRAEFALAGESLPATEVRA